MILWVLKEISIVTG